MIDFQFFGCDREGFETTKHPIFIGISVSSRPMPLEVISEYLTWAEQHSSHTVQILVADEIAMYNYRAFSHYTKPGSLSRAIRDGDKHEEQIRKAITTLPSETQNCFNIIRWPTVRCDEYNFMLEILESDFKKNPAFRNLLFSVLDTLINKRQKHVSHDSKLLLAQYLLEELPTLFDGIYVDGVNYTTVLYPTYMESGLSQIIVDIQKGKQIPSIDKHLCMRKTTLIEAVVKAK